jgi:uncharacterized lipoprotein YajG
MMRRIKQWVALAVVSIIAIFVLAACQAEQPAPAAQNTPAATEPEKEKDEPVYSNPVDITVEPLEEEGPAKEQ